MRKFLIALLLLTLFFSGCASTKNFEGNRIEVKEEGFYAKIEPVRVFDEKPIERQIGYDNRNLKATGMTLSFHANDQAHEVQFSDIKATYSLDGSEPRPMEVAYTETHHNVTSKWNRLNLLRAYLIPTGATEPPEKEIDHLDQTTRPMETGRYQVHVTLRQDEMQRDFAFDFVYKGRVYYQAPNFNVSGK